MAIRFDAAGDYLIRSANLPGNDPFSCAFWAYISVDRNAPGVWVAISDGTFTNYFLAGLSSAGDVLLIDAAGSTTNGSTLSVGTWYHVALTRNGNTKKLYLNGVLDITNTTATTFTSALLLVGSNTVNFVNGRVAGLKVWEAELTLEEVLQEMHTIRPARFANLYGWWPMLPGSGERARDYSGNGRDFTETGSLVDEDPPPVSWGGQSLVFPFVSDAGGDGQPTAKRFGGVKFAHKVGQGVW